MLTVMSLYGLNATAPAGGGGTRGGAAAAAARPAVAATPGGGRAGAAAARRRPRLAAAGAAAVGHGLVALRPPVGGVGLALVDDDRAGGVGGARVPDGAAAGGAVGRRRRGRRRRGGRRSGRRRRRSASGRASRSRCRFVHGSPVPVVRCWSRARCLASTSWRVDRALVGDEGRPSTRCRVPGRAGRGGRGGRVDRGDGGGQCRQQLELALREESRGRHGASAFRRSG